MKCVNQASCLLFIAFSVFVFLPSCDVIKLESEWTEQEMEAFRSKVKSMFYFAYDNYIQKAYPHDELKPISGKGHDTYGGVSVTLVDALDTLAVLGNKTEFARVVDIIDSNLDLDSDVNVSVFETNIRVLGGLLSGHLMYREMDMKLPANWPCDGPLLRKAKILGDKLMEAFDTPTGMPYGTINLKRGVNPKETPITCTACVGTYYIEFATLSRLTGNPVYEATATRALESLFAAKSPVGLVGNHINVTSGRWMYTDSTIGAGVDSYFEYLMKGSVLTGQKSLYGMFKTLFQSIQKYLNKDDWHIWAALNTGNAVLPYFNSLEAFWPGLMTLYGDIDYAKRSFANYYSLWEYYGFVPEFMNIQKLEALKGKEGYPLRPELIESAYYLFQATRDPFYLSVGRQVIKSLESSAKVDFGYAHVHRVSDHALEDQMESFFLAETIKYLYLLYDVDNFINSEGTNPHVVHLNDGTECVINSAGYVFNTEAHPVDLSALYCCHNAAVDLAIIKARSKKFDKALFSSNIPTKTKAFSKFPKPVLLRDLAEESVDRSAADLKDQLPFLTCHYPLNNVSRSQCPDTLNSYLVETAFQHDPVYGYGIDSSEQFCSDRCHFSKVFIYGQLISKNVCY